MLVREKDIFYYTDELYHHGVKGMKWGVRKKYLNSSGELTKKGSRRVNKLSKKYSKNYKTHDFDKEVENDIAKNYAYGTEKTMWKLTRATNVSELRSTLKRWAIDDFKDKDKSYQELVKIYKDAGEKGKKKVNKILSGYAPK